MSMRIFFTPVLDAVYIQLLEEHENVERTEQLGNF